ncbi:uncharacterized protein LOC100881082 [Megachile rotundata]|uniref:uncharacterized protein LOC100881082 n=1 Tax=Megachile rotundata TaxID=143995 RepID=UPI003FD23BC6
MIPQDFINIYHRCAYYTHLIIHQGTKPSRKASISNTTPISSDNIKICKLNVKSREVLYLNRVLIRSRANPNYMRIGRRQ